MARVYVAASRSMVRRLVIEGRLPGPLPAHSVTGELRAAWQEGDDEEWEYAALMAAAADSLGRRGTGDPPRRYVLAADAGQVEVGAGTAVTLPEGLTWAQVAALHADADDLADEDLRDQEALAEEDLAWFATQEVAALL